MSEHVIEDTDEPLEQIDEQIDDLETAVAELEQLGDDISNPAIERNAKRIAGVVAALRRQVPPEVVDRRD